MFSGGAWIELASHLPFTIMSRSNTCGGTIGDPDVIALSGRTVDVKWYYFRASSGLWYTVTSSGNVLALKSVSETFTGGILWKPINNYGAYAGYPATGNNYTSVQVAADGRSVRFGALLSGGSDLEIANLADTTQQVTWFYFTNYSAKWFIVS